MKTLIVCYSMSGNVASVSERIANEAGASVLRIYPEESYPDKGAKKFLWGGKSALMGEKPALLPYEVNWDEYDHVVLAYPVWAATFPPPIRSFVLQNAEELKKKTLSAVACFAGSGEEKSLKKLAAFLGVESFFATACIQDPYKKKPEIQENNENAIREFVDRIAAAGPSS